MKKYFIVSMAVIMAIAASAFNVINSKTTGDQFGNSGSTGSNQYEKLSSPYSSTNCSTASQACGYQVTTAGNSHVTESNYSSSEMEYFLSQGWVEKIGTTNGTYSE